MKYLKPWGLSLGLTATAIINAVNNATTDNNNHPRGFILIRLGTNHLLNPVCSILEGGCGKNLEPRIVYYCLCLTGIGTL